MTWTSAVGRSGKWLLYKVVHGLALTRISPNALTFIGLCINVVAGILFGYAHAENQRRMLQTFVVHFHGHNHRGESRNGPD